MSSSGPRWVRGATTCLLLLALWSCGDPSARIAGEPEFKAWVTIGHSRLPVELALTPEEQNLGLGERDALPWGHGMLFIHERPAFRRYWMRGMRFDIDIVWIRDGRVVEIAHRVTHVPGETGPVVTSSELVDQVLEVPAGYAQTQNWRRGQRVEIDRPDPGG
ncbi:MAG: DUF192 domain-containing protein [Myxococcota bacterium]